ncbi:YIF1-domain-containing protein, partial [Lentinula raphanica]
MSSPPPLRHPVSTHPAYIPEPPSTPGSPNGFQRFSSSPGPARQQQQSQSAMLQQQQQHPSFVPQPGFAAWGVNDATAQFGMRLGSSAVAAGQECSEKWIIHLSSIKHHFNASNSYVIHKLELVSWCRRVHRSEQGQAEYQDPREDINSPHLYMPRTIFSAFHSVRVEILGEFASLALAVVIADFLFVYIGCYLLNVQTSKQVVDIIAYSGYKFVGWALSLFYSTSASLYYIFLFDFFANGLFLLRSLRSLVLPD